MSVYTLKDGRAYSSITKGTRIILPILAVHRSKAIWGEDALEFKYVFTTLSAHPPTHQYTGRSAGIIYRRLCQVFQVFGATS